MLKLKYKHFTIRPIQFGLYEVVRYAGAYASIHASVDDAKKYIDGVVEAESNGF